MFELCPILTQAVQRNLFTECTWDYSNRPINFLNRC